MDDIAQLICVLDAYAAHTGLAETTISTRIFGRGTRIRELRSGGDMGSRTVRRALEKLAECWPENAPWPEGVARPESPSNHQAAE
jgi:hypothetical protein